ncbi:MAG: glycosyltransferase family 2 protein [Clostridia bacterium]|nr:glycosyltransferase family 2 protein [Clostridia bacterium]
MKQERKLISIVVPVYNEQDCLQTLYERTTAVMERLSDYAYEIVFFDDGSVDNSRRVITAICERDEHCKAVFLARNYGYNIAIFHAMQQAKGDCAVLLHADLQNPPEVIPEFVAQWEQGHDVVFGIKNKSKENRIMYSFRTLAYWTMNGVFGMHLIPHATDFELVDKSMIKALRSISRSEPILRIILQKNARNPKRVYYVQDRRIAGKSAFNLKKYYELAVSWIVASSTVLPRRFLCVGLVMFVASLVELFAGFLPHIEKFTYANISTPLMVRLLFIMFAVMVCFAAVMGEYLFKSYQNVQPTPVCEDKRIHY